MDEGTVLCNIVNDFREYDGSLISPFRAGMFYKHPTGMFDVKEAISWRNTDMVFYTVRFLIFSRTYKMGDVDKCIFNMIENSNYDKSFLDYISNLNDYLCLDWGHFLEKAVNKGYNYMIEKITPLFRKKDHNYFLCILIDNMDCISGAGCVSILNIYLHQLYLTGYSKENIIHDMVGIHRDVVFEMVRKAGWVLKESDV